MFGNDPIEDLEQDNYWKDGIESSIRIIIQVLYESSEGHRLKTAEYESDGIATIPIPRIGEKLCLKNTEGELEFVVKDVINRHILSEDSNESFDVSIQIIVEKA